MRLRFTLPAQSRSAHTGCLPHGNFSGIRCRNRVIEWIQAGAARMYPGRLQIRAWNFRLSRTRCRKKGSPEPAFWIYLDWTLPTTRPRLGFPDCASWTTRPGLRVSDYASRKFHECSALEFSVNQAAKAFNAFGICTKITFAQSGCTAYLHRFLIIADKKLHVVDVTHDFRCECGMQVTLVL